jgi:DNA-directed RNA polymerase subunit K/omega
MNIPDEIQKVREADVTKYRSKPLMTKYEFDQLIGLRTTHLSRGAVPFVEIPEDFKIHSNMELRKIALMEMREGKLPYLVKRTMPFGKPECEYWKIKDLDLSSVRNLLRD